MLAGFLLAYFMLAIWFLIIAKVNKLFKFTFLRLVVFMFFYPIIMAEVMVSYF